MPGYPGLGRLPMLEINNFVQYAFAKRRRFLRAIWQKAEVKLKSIKPKGNPVNLRNLRTRT